MKLYNLGLVVGRFQMLHNGHVSMIKSALELCEKVVVFIGSSQESGTDRNPFTYNVREDMINTVFASDVKNNRLVIRPLPDIGVGNNDIWGRYVMGIFEAEFKKQPDLYVTGCEKERPSWFTNDVAPNMDELRISKNNIRISAAVCRSYIRDNKVDEWCKSVDCSLHKKYENYKEILERIKK